MPSPPRATNLPEFERRSSTLVVPVALPLGDLEGQLEKETPRRLWAIDRPNSKCVPGQRVNVLGRRLKVTPDITCRIVGEVTRGRIRLTGSGQRLKIEMPIQAIVRARDIAGVLKGETATASAVVRGDVMLDVDRNWQPNAKVEISYDWREPPGIDFLGQRISFARKADQDLVGVVAGLERQVQRQIAQAGFKPLVTDIWRQGFTTIELSGENPPAWMRVTPQSLGLVSYRVAGRVATLTVALQALTETFVGERPAQPQPTPLPPQVPPARNTGLSFFMPVIADYSELEPVLLKALRKLAAKGIRIDGVGGVDATFRDVTIYATQGNRLAVGIDVVVEPIEERTGIRLGKSQGFVWLTASPISEANSQVVRFSGLAIYGRTDSVSGNLLIRFAESDGVRHEITQSLTQDFTRDYERILGKARRAVANRRIGSLVLSARIDRIEHDRVQVTGAGLFMPMIATGTAQVRLDAR